jgi:PhnB protein
MITPYLNFDGRCDEALEFYKKAIGAEVEMLLRFHQSPEPNPDCPVPPENANKVMHVSVRVGDARFMASDCDCEGKTQFQGVTLALYASDPDQAEKYFQGLSDGGQVTMPLAKTFFSPCFGMLTDRFGVSWMVIVQ